MAHESQDTNNKMWPPQIKQIFIDIILDEQLKGNMKHMKHGIFKAITWQSITKTLNEQPGKSFLSK